nr:hypothetical protein [Desulfuromonadales bacterium]
MSHSFVFVVSLLYGGGAFAQDIAVVEPPLDVKAAQFVSSDLMAGPNHEVQPTATNDGFVNTYDVGTEWGDVKAVGDYRLRVRVQEANALRALDDMSRAGIFGDSLVNGALAPVEAAVDLVTAPVDTVSDAAEGVGRWFGNMADSITSDDPHQEGAMSAAVGWAQTKRAFAVELGVDPYTDWEPLQEALVSVARAAFAGGITAKVAMGMATEGTALELPVLALGLTSTMKKKLVDNPPERLAELHREELAALGVSDAAIEPFLDNHHYSPMEKLQFVEALTRMKGTEGLEALVVHASTAPDKPVARYMQQQAEMMAKFVAGSPSSILLLKEAPMLQTQDGRLVGVFPLDYVVWTARLAKIMQNLTSQADGAAEAESRELWFEGVASPETRDGMETNGWTVKEKAQLLIGAT